MNLSYMAEKLPSKTRYWKKDRGTIGVKGIRGWRRKELPDDFKVKQAYCKKKEEVLDRTLWRTAFGRGYGHVRQAKEWMN
jgi:hypothetical protein